MNKLSKLAIVAASAIVVAAPATAAGVVCSSNVGTPSCDFDGESGTLGHIISQGATFSDTYHFLFDEFGAADVSFTLAKNPKSGLSLNFSSVTFDGVSFAAVAGQNYTFFGLTARPEGYDLVVNGSNPATDTSLSYSGTVAFSPAVPEPASWALMIGGFGAVGGVLRRRARPAGVLAAA